MRSNDDHPNEALLRFLVVFPHDTSARLMLSGDVDISTVEGLSSMLTAIRAAGVRTLEVDASDVQFAGCAFLRVIEDHAPRFEKAGGSLVVVQPSRAVRRLFELATSARARSLTRDAGAPRRIPVVAE